MLKLELVLSVLAVAWAFAFPRAGARWFERIENFFQPLAERRTLSVIAVGILAVVARVAVLPVLPIPAPAIHDEFSYLLMADTFAHGRLANPTPPLWVHFETFHENMIPTYSSMFYPAQGLFLAAGQVVFGHPFWGVVLSSALMCAAICWMLQAWMPTGWALLGGILAIIRLATFSYWVNSYWGGAVAALGGALVLGALPRIKIDQRVRNGIVSAAGVALLLCSRPFESLFFLFPIGISFLVWLRRNEQSYPARSMRQAVLSLAICLALAVGLMGYYFWRTTRSPIRPTYIENIRQYAVAPYFPWQNLRPAPEYHNAQMQKFYEQWPVAQYEDARRHPVQNLLLKAVSFWLFFSGPLFTAPFIVIAAVLPYGFRWVDLRAELRSLMIVFVASLSGLALPIFFLPHYAAPLTCIFFALTMAVLRYLSNWTHNKKPTGRAMIFTLAAVCILLLPIRIFAARLKIGLMAPALKTWASDTDRIPFRDALSKELASLPVKSLVVVRYTPRHDFMAEWVYNGADIENEKIIWARDMGPAENRELINYYKGRRVWLLEPDETPPRLQPYPEESQAKQCERPAP